MTTFHAHGGMVNLTTAIRRIDQNTVSRWWVLKFLRQSLLLVSAIFLTLMVSFIGTGTPWWMILLLAVILVGLSYLTALLFISTTIRSIKVQKPSKTAGAGSDESRGTLDTLSVTVITKFVAK